MRVIAAIICLIALSGAASCETYRFAITRNGDQIGTHSINLNRTGAETSVSIVTDLTVKVLFVTAYRFQYTASERWLNGRLVALNATTDDNGTRHQVSVVTAGTTLQIDADGKTARLDRTIIPATLWNPELMRRPVMLDTQEGQVLPLTVVDQGPEDLTIDSRVIKAHHYIMKSKYSQDVWYDDQQHLVQVKLIGPDGSVIMYKPL
jgi:Family of unknown function (DUF6134)